MPLIYILDDEKEIRKSLRVILEDEGYLVEDFANPKSLLKTLSKEVPSLLFLDVWLGKEDGLHVLEECRHLYPTLPIVMISGHGTIEMAVNATKKGALDFLEKPLSLEKVIDVVESILAIKENGSAENGESLYPEILGNSKEMERIRFAVQQAAQTNTRVFLYGENGTGKELVATWIHTLSKRPQNIFFRFDCDSFAEEQLEITLFGDPSAKHKDTNVGFLYSMKTGTLYLKEIQSLPLSLQNRLLQFFLALPKDNNENGQIRIISSSTVSLEDNVREGKFRKDLYYYLNVIPVEVPALRDRIEDIPILVDYFLELAARENSLPKRILEDGALDILKGHYWPGNVRELKNIVERLTVLSKSQIIPAREVKESLLGFKRANEMVAQGDLKHAKEEFERQYIIRTLQTCDGNVTRASKALGIERTHLYRKMKSLQIQMEIGNDSN